MWIQTKTDKIPEIRDPNENRKVSYRSWLRWTSCAWLCRHFKSFRSTKKRFLCGQLTPAIVYDKSGNCHGKGMISRLECLPGKNENLKKKGLLSIDTGQLSQEGGWKNPSFTTFIIRQNGRGINIFMNEFFIYFSYLVGEEKIVEKSFIPYLIGRYFILYQPF